jgi:hypothetical protein
MEDVLLKVNKVFVSVYHLQAPMLSLEWLAHKKISIGRVQIESVNDVDYFVFKFKSTQIASDFFTYMTNNI